MDQLLGNDCETRLAVAIQRPAPNNEVLLEEVFSMWSIRGYNTPPTEFSSVRVSAVSQ